MKPIIKKLSLLLAVALTAACGDMKLQTDADYDHSVLDPHIPMTAWEYFETRTDIFSEFMAAVEYAGMKEYYTQTGREYTFLALTNTAVKAFVSTYPDKSKITDCPKEDVQNLLRYHIIDGFYSGYGELPVEAIFVLTLRRGEEGLIDHAHAQEPLDGRRRSDHRERHGHERQLAHAQVRELQHHADQRRDPRLRLLLLLQEIGHDEH